MNLNNSLTLNKYVTCYQVLCKIKKNKEIILLYFPNGDIKYVDECIDLFTYLISKILKAFLVVYNADNNINITIDQLCNDYNSLSVVEFSNVNDVLSDCVYLLLLFNDIITRLFDADMLFKDKNVIQPSLLVGMEYHVNFSQYNYTFKTLSLDFFSDVYMGFYLETFFSKHDLVILKKNVSLRIV